MEGITVKHAGKDYFPMSDETQLDLLAENDGVEIMLQTIKADDFVMLTPSDDKGLSEYAWIVRGEIDLECDGESLHLSTGDFFSFRNLKKTVIAKCSVPVTLLYISSKPIFFDVTAFAKNLDELVNKVDEKDHYTKMHCQHVMDYAIAISRKMGCDFEMTERLAISALFHDVGKCCIPDEILNKPGKLTEEEFQFIFKHPMASKEYVEDVFGKEIAQIVLCHHERLDGSGYPQGLNAGEIPIEAKIIAVADAFDAMTTQRPYNHPKNFPEAAEELVGMPEVYLREATQALQWLVLHEELTADRKS